MFFRLKSSKVSSAALDKGYLMDVSTCLSSLTHFSIEHFLFVTWTASEHDWNRVQWPSDADAVKHARLLQAVVEPYKAGVGLKSLYRQCCVLLERHQQTHVRSEPGGPDKLCAPPAPVLPMIFWCWTRPTNRCCLVLCIVGVVDLDVDQKTCFYALSVFILSHFILIV